MLNREATNGLELWHGLNELENNAGIRELGNTGRGSEILHYTNRVTLWRLIGADEAPLRIVEFTGRNELACSLLNRG